MIENQNNNTVRYSDEDLLEFKILIEDKLEVAQKELDFMREQIVELNETSGDQQGGDWFDDSSIHTELEMLNNQVIRQQQFISNLKNALVRIQNKTYGICSVTGNLIDKKRLQLVPHATKSVAAKEEKSSVVQEKVFEEVVEEVKPKQPVDSARPKVVTKIIKKTGGKPSKASKVAKEDDFEDWNLDLDEDLSVEDTAEYSLGMNFDDIPDNDEPND